MKATVARKLIRDLEAEINNGGFDQFFFNTAGNKTQETIAALEAVGAKRTAKVVKKAAARFPGGMPPTDRKERQELLSNSVSPDSDAFDDDDAAFLEYRDDLEALAAKYAG